MIDPLPSDIFQVGQILNNTYEILGVLGRGGTGEVYKAENTVTGRIFAIKALNARFSGNADYVELMKREEQIRSIMHPSVVRYNECSRTDDGHVYLVMDFIDGRSLADEMQIRRMEPRELMIIGHRIAEGLVAAHNHGIVHRDLSPDNIILSDGAADQATIIDFGIAKDTAAGARTVVGNEFAGKYEYAAPEQLDGQADGRSDLYALGATLLAAYRGETPYLGTTPGEIVRRKATALDLDGVPDPLRNLIAELTEPRPDDRPPTAEAVVQRIDDLLKPVSGEKRNAAKKGKQKKEKENGGGFGLLLPALLVVLIGAVGVAGWLFRDAILPDQTPIAAPYRIAATSIEGGNVQLSGNAPDETAAAQLIKTFTSVTGRLPEAGALEIARGVPDDSWIFDVGRLFELTELLDSWTLDISDKSVEIAGLAATTDARSRAEEALTGWAESGTFTLSMDILAGPETLTRDVVFAASEPFATCGPLAIAPGPWALGETVSIRGSVASEADVQAMQQALTRLVGSRSLDIRLGIVNGPICSIRATLPPNTNSGGMSIWLGNSDDGSANITGVYETGDVPLAILRAPATMSEGYLQVMIVTNTGKVLQVVPFVNNPEQSMAALGDPVDGQWQVPFLHSAQTYRANRSKPAIQIDPEFGKNEIIAIVSDRPLDTIRRPKEESAASAAQMLRELFQQNQAEILGIASRVIESRRP